MLTGGVELPAGVSPEQYRRAEQEFQEMYGRSAERRDVLLLLGEAAVHADRLQVALACFREVPTADPLYGPSARLQEGQVLARLPIGEVVAR